MGSGLYFISGVADNLFSRVNDVGDANKVKTMTIEEQVAELRKQVFAKTLTVSEFSKKLLELKGKKSSPTDDEKNWLRANADKM